MWVVIQPLLLATFLVLIKYNLITNLTFSQTDYILMFAILIAWQFFSTSFQRGASSLDANYHLISRVTFPKVLLPLSAIVSAFIDSLVNVFLLFFSLLFVKKMFFVNIFYLPLILLFSCMFIAALTLIFSMLICFVADIKHLVPFITQLSLFGLPILFNESFIPSWFRNIYESFPLVWMISEIKEIISTNHLIFNGHTFIVSLISIASLFIAFLIFTKLERFVVDFI